MFHVHKWVRIKETTTPQFKSIPICSEHMAERMLFGITTILWECEICQQIKKEEMLGK